jgi:hypothetical protein
MTKNEKKMVEFMRVKLGTNPTWARRALIRIFENQTEYEQSAETVNEFNGIGFTKSDGQLLTSFANQLSDRGFLSPKQMNILFRRMPKYAGQLFETKTDKAHLLEIMEREGVTIIDEDNTKEAV